MLTLDTLPDALPFTMKADTYERYAIYFAPEKDTPLYQFGRTWFGQDIDNNTCDIERRCYGLGDETVRRLTLVPSRYGFHATLKAPFYLADAKSPHLLQQEIRNFAARQRPFKLHNLTLAEYDGQLVLALADKNEELDKLARACVANFDEFRAPLTKQERDRRNQKFLTERQHNLFEQWGYPYTFEEYRFHITLTGPITNKEITQLLPVLAPALKDVSMEPVTVKSICLFGDPGDNRRFKLIERFPFDA